MPHYVTLMRWTSQGVAGLPAWRDRIEEGERVIAEAGGAERLQPWHQRLVTEALIALTGIPQRDHDPPIIGGTGRVVGLALGKAPVRRMNTSDPRFVLIFGPTGEPVDDAESRHVPSRSRCRSSERS